MEAGQPAPGSLYIYAPNKGAPIFFTIAFAASAVGHFWQCYRYKSFKLLGLHPFCAVLLTAGYAMRAYAALGPAYLFSKPNLLVYILSQVFIYICPPLLELVNYRVLGRILHYVPYFAPMPPTRVMSTFGAQIALVETLNSLGVAFSSNPSSSASSQGLGKRLTTAALAMQLGVIVVFVVIATIFHRRCLSAKIQIRPISTPLVILYTSMTLIFARCLYRLVEYLGDTNVRLNDPESLKALSPALRYEGFFYVFEASLILVNSLLWNIWNPGRYLPRNENAFLSRDGRTELQGTKKPDDRTPLEKTACYLSFGLFFRRKEPWEGLDNHSLDDR